MQSQVKKSTSARMTILNLIGIGNTAPWQILQGSGLKVLQLPFPPISHGACIAFLSCIAQAHLFAMRTAFCQRPACRFTVSVWHTRPPPCCPPLRTTRKLSLLQFFYNCFQTCPLFPNTYHMHHSSRLRTLNCISFCNVLMQNTLKYHFQNENDTSLGVQQQQNSVQLFQKFRYSVQNG